MRFKATVESCGGNEYIGYVRILSRGHLKYVRTDFEINTFGVDVNEVGTIAGVEVYAPKRIFKKYRTALAQTIEQMEKKVDPKVREELHDGITKAFDWMEEEIRDGRIAEYEAAAYVYGSDTC